MGEHDHFNVVVLLKLGESILSAPVASHHHHPPRAPCSPQPGCFYGNNRICSGPVHTVSSLSLLLACFPLFSQSLTASSWLLPILV